MGLGKAVQTSWSRFCSVIHQTSACNYQLSQIRTCHGFEPIFRKVQSECVGQNTTAHATENREDLTD